MISLVRFASSHHSSSSNSPALTPTRSISEPTWPNFSLGDTEFDSFERGEPDSPTVSEVELLFGPPAPKPIEISLSKLYKQIRSMPAEIAARMIPREKLVAELLSNHSNQACKKPSWENTFFINLIAKVSSYRMTENNRYLQRSLQTGNTALFSALLKHTAQPDFAPLFEIAALQDNAGAFSKLMYTAQKTNYVIPKAVLEYVAESGRQDQLTSLMSFSRLPSEQKKQIWRLAQSQKDRINELRGLSLQERQSQFNRLALSDNWNANQSLQNRKELIALIRAGVDVNYQESEWSDVPLVNAARTQNEVLLKTLLQAGADVTKTDGWKHTALFEAAYNKNDAIFDALIKAGSDPDQYVNSKQDTAVNFAAKLGYSQVIDKYAQAGADVNKPNDLGDTPLLSAAEKGHTKAAESLINAGANVNHGGLNGITPLQSAAGSGKDSLVKVLIKAGADLNAFDNSWETPLTWAADSKSEAVVTTLLDAGANPRLSFPLVSAARRRSLPIAKLLIEKGANVNAGNLQGESPLHWAEQWRKADLIQLLRDHGAQRIVDPAPSSTDLEFNPPVFPSLW